MAKGAVKSLNATLLKQAADNRHGVTFESQMATHSKSDLSALYHAGVPSSALAPWESASGGVSRTEEFAILAAIGESIERFSAATVNIETYTESQLKNKDIIPYEDWPLFTPDQKNDQTFPFSAIYDDETHYVAVRSFLDDSVAYVPQPLVVLRDDFRTGLPTSSGLAAATNTKHALLSALLELVERDALMVTWVNALAGHKIELPETYSKEVQSLHGECNVYDITPAYSPFPVIAVIGGVPKEGKMRYSLGVACKTTYNAAIEKAYSEWHQGVFFAGIYNKNVDTSHLETHEDVNTFDDHAVYYTLYPELWDDLAIFADSKVRSRRLSLSEKAPTTEQALRKLKTALKRVNIRTYYIDVTGVDAVQSGVRVIRAVSPDLAMIFAHQSWPLIQRVDTFRRSRYPKTKPQFDFPYRMPHPLG